MKALCLITYRTTMEKRKEYADAAAHLGTSITALIRKALDTAVERSKSLPPGITWMEDDDRIEVPK